MTDPIIRPMRMDDAADWHELRTQPGVIWGTMQLPTLSMEDVRQQAAYNPNVHKLAAEVDGKMVGTIGLHTSTGCQQHVGYLGMSIHDAYQGKGLGRRLMDAVLDLADNWLMLDRIALGVYPDNQAAVHLYNTAGFEWEGLSPRCCYRDGELVDMMHMGRIQGRATANTALPPTAPPRTAAPPITPI
ncbi:MAG TPA: GNAT family N-acetyltransferase, partial [Symbiobacteriaceae bacterium]|nr:GNAT family N-acetyltransferase [Symbiobacteriaceae bacterium]